MRSFNSRNLLWLPLTLLLGIAPMAHADDDETLFNVVNLQAQAEREVPNDQMIAVLATEHEGSEPSRIATDVNRDMQWALAIVKRRNYVDAKTGSYQTYPVYNRNTITGWRANQQLELRSENISGLTELVGELQERLQVKQMHFTPTDATRKQIQNELIEEAMEAFRERVTIVAKHMDNPDYRIVNIHINTNDFQPPIVYDRGAARTMAMESAAPAVEAGTSKVNVSVSGSVQFY